MFLQYSLKNTCVGVSFSAFTNHNSADLLDIILDFVSSQKYYSSKCIFFEYKIIHLKKKLKRIPETGLC